PAEAGGRLNPECRADRGSVTPFPGGELRLRLAIGIQGLDDLAHCELVPLEDAAHRPEAVQIRPVLDAHCPAPPTRLVRIGRARTGSPRPGPASRAREIGGGGPPPPPASPGGAGRRAGPGTESERAGRR